MTPVYSLNAEAPAALDRIVSSIADDLALFDERRETHTLLVKRLGDRRTQLHGIDDRLEPLLSRWGPIEARLTGFDVFADPPGGVGPVVYLAVDSPGLEALHRDLCDRFGEIDGRFEGASYVPHITLVRGGERTAIGRLTGRSFDTVTWTIDELVLWDSRYNQAIRRYSLPFRR